MNIRRLKVGQYLTVSCKDLVNEGLGLSHFKDSDLNSLVKPQTGFILGLLPGETAIVRVVQVTNKAFHGVLVNRDEILSLSQKNQQIEEKDETGDDTAVNTRPRRFVLPLVEQIRWLWPEEIEQGLSAEYLQRLGSLLQQYPRETKWLVQEPNSHRVVEDCQNFIHCGGCKMRHLSYTSTLEFKKKWYLQMLRHRQLAEEIEMIPAVKTAHYRNHVQVHINKHKQRGFYGPSTYTTIPFPEHGCLIFDQQLFDQKFPENLELCRCVRARLDTVAENKNAVITELNSVEDKHSQAGYTVEYPAGSRTFISLPQTAFFQVNTSMIPVWLEKIEKLLRSLNIEAPIAILELFSGSGFISQMLSQRFEIHSIGLDILSEKEIRQTSFYDVNGETVGNPFFYENYIHADLNNLEKLSEKNRKRLRSHQPAVVILNPPRNGFVPAQADILFEQILASFPRFIIYSSCNAATFCRDADHLRQKGYQMNNSILLDFFPFTAHFEVLALFELN